MKELVVQHLKYSFVRCLRDNLNLGTYYLTIKPLRVSSGEQLVKMSVYTRITTTVFEISFIRTDVISRSDYFEKYHVF